VLQVQYIFCNVALLPLNPNYESNRIQFLEGENTNLLNIPTRPCGLSSYYQSVQCGSEGSI